MISELNVNLWRVTLFLKSTDPQKKVRKPQVDVVVETDPDTDIRIAVNQIRVKLENKANVEVTKTSYQRISAQFVLRYNKE